MMMFYGLNDDLRNSDFIYNENKITLTGVSSAYSFRLEFEI